MAPSGMLALATALLIVAQCAGAKVPIITTFAGTGVNPGFSGDGGSATAAVLNLPMSVAVGPDGRVYIGDAGNRRVRVVSTSGIISTLAELDVSALAVGPDGSVYVASEADQECKVRRVSPSGAVTTVAGSGSCKHSGDGGPATAAGLDTPAGLAVGRDGSLYIACPGMGDARVRRVSPSGVITTFAGTGAKGYTGDGGPANKATLDWPYGLAVGPDGSVYISDTPVVRRVLPSGIITTYAGNGSHSYSGDGGKATEATMKTPRGLAVRADGALFIADINGQAVRLVSPEGIITTYAGNGIQTYSGDGGPATAASVYMPTGVALGPDGSLYIGNTFYYPAVRRVIPASLPSPSKKPPPHKRNPNPRLRRAPSPKYAHT